MELKFTVLSKLSSRSEFSNSLWDFLDVLSHLPDDDYFTVAIVSPNSLYCFDFYTGKLCQKASSLFKFIDFVKEISKGGNK